ncbi:hypothetical protein ES703_67321 [subsurface metagenome]
MAKLNRKKLELINKYLKEGKFLPDDYKPLLFDTKKEYEIVYLDKEREEDILADTMAVPLQRIKIFRNGKNINGWTNMLIFGDNLQVLKILLQMKQEGKLKNADGTPGVRLVYIDPPFATRQEFRGSQDQKAYQDKIAGARFLEFLRKRLVFLRELLTEDGSIYVHLDYKKAHYVKILMDEIFDETKFESEVVFKRTLGHHLATGMDNMTDSIFVFRKGEEWIFNQPYQLLSQEELDEKFPFLEEETGRHFTHEKLEQSSNVYSKDQIRIIQGKKVTTKLGWRWSQETFENRIAENPYIIFWTEDGRPRYKRYVDEYEGRKIGNLWDDIELISSNSRQATGYPTQKPEALLDRIIKASSNPGDLVLDCFAGSGTTQAVAEKLGRRWIGMDCGKLAIYTTQKRLLNLREEIGNLGKLLKARPFTLYNAGLYDYKMIKELPWEQYRDFALKLFQCRDERHEISKIELDGYLGADSVMVFNYQKHKDAVMDRDFIDDLHKHLGDKIGRRFFIIAPAASVKFLEDYIDKGKTKYFIFRIPYSIIEEIHNRGFTKIKQPVSEMNVNDTVDAVGFDFIQMPTVECKYFIDDKKGQLRIGEGAKECVIKLEKFESKVISRKSLEFANLETLSMLMLDYDFEGEIFDLDEVFYAEELKKNDYEVRFAKDKVKGQIMVIYIDIFGNEKREIKTLSDFNGKRKK